ncbi:heavy metal-binding domain-containing protein [Paenibacillus sp. NPDC058071]
MAASVGRDILASFTNLVGGCSKAYEAKLREARDVVFREMTQEA